MAGRGRAKSRDDHHKPYACDLLWRGLCAAAKRHRAVRYEQSATGALYNIFSCASSVLLMCSMSAQDIWARKYCSFCTALWKWMVSLVNKQCNLNDHAEQLHHCCLVPHKNMRTQA